MIKKIEIEMHFEDDFVPPTKFDRPLRINRYNSKCKLCPFYGWDDETAYGWCNVTAVRDVEEECPIKKFFD
jgi:hypothetical protein